MVGASGFEPLTTRTPSVCATRLRYAPTVGLKQPKCNIPTDLNQFIERIRRESVIRGFKKRCLSRK
jgi:hypothetical protein